MRRLDLERLGHEADDVRLRNRLLVADGKRVIVVRTRPHPRGDEQMALHPRHRIEHAWASDIPRAKLVLDHAPPLGAPAVFCRLMLWRRDRAAQRRNDDHNERAQLDDLHALQVCFDPCHFSSRRSVRVRRFGEN